MLVDAHVHLNNYHERPASESSTREENVSRLRAEMRTHGIDHAVVITSYRVNLDRPSVEDLVGVIDGDPRLTLVEGLRWRGPPEGRTDLFAMEERIRDGVVKGIKLYPGYEPYAINDPSLEAVFRMASKYKVPVVIHTGDTYSKSAKLRFAHPLLVDDVATDYPDTTFVMCHLGNPWFRDTAEVLYKNDNVFADISGLALGAMTNQFERFVLRQLKEMIAHMGDPSRQLMYGSDWPLVEMGPYLHMLRSLRLPPEQAEAVQWRTAAKLFRIDLDASRARAATGEAGPGAGEGASVPGSPEGS